MNWRWLFYEANIAWVRGLLLLVTSRDVKGRKNVPKTGPLILTSNHLNNADPPILTGSFPRQISWMTKAEWFKTPLVGWMFKQGGMVPVRRFEADLQALRQAQQVLNEGRVLGMFPEGTRSKDKQLHHGEPGSALIALRSGAPVLPAAIWGTENVHLPRDVIGRTRAHIRFGKPYTLPKPKGKISREDVEQGTQLIMKKIAELLPEKYRGPYADTEPAPEAGSTASAEK